MVSRKVMFRAYLFMGLLSALTLEIINKDKIAGIGLIAYLLTMITFHIIYLPTYKQ